MEFLCCPPLMCGPRSDAVHRDVYKESMKALEADIMHANTLLSGEMLKDSEGASLQLRLSFSPLAPLLLFLFNWADCSLAGALGLMRVLVYKVYRDGVSTAGIQERRATLRQFCGFLYPALQQLYPGVSEAELRQQQQHCREAYLSKRERSCCAGSSRSSSSHAHYAAGNAARSTSIAPDILLDECGVRESSQGGLCGEASSGRAAPYRCTSMSMAEGLPVGFRVAAIGCAGSSRGLDHSSMDAAEDCCSCARGVEGRECGSDEYAVLPPGWSAAAMVAERERERECGICLEERKGRVALPQCGHNMCSACFHDWSSRSLSCPFCRRALERVDSADLWDLVESSEAEDPGKILRESIARLLLFVNRLPVVLSDGFLVSYDYVAAERRPLV